MQGTPVSNRQQIELWNGARGALWVAEHEARDRQLAPFGDAALRLAAVAPGERIIDVGCGCGTTTLGLADIVGPRGHVLAIDVSEPMLAYARAHAHGRSNITWYCSDASTYPFEEASAEVLFSRFGIMFFDDPAAAFANLGRALKHRGRLAFVCWRGLAHNDWMRLPLLAAQSAAPFHPPPPQDAPGPLAFADSERVRLILKRAGFQEIALEPIDLSIALGDGQGLDAATAQAMTIGPTAALLRDAEDVVRARARDAVRAALVPYVEGDDVSLAASAWVVTALRSSA
jgi:SAM-dependent methyltransferase